MTCCCLFPIPLLLLLKNDGGAGHTNAQKDNGPHNEKGPLFVVRRGGGAVLVGVVGAKVLAFSTLHRQGAFKLGLFCGRKLNVLAKEELGQGGFFVVVVAVISGEKSL